MAERRKEPTWQARLLEAWQGRGWIPLVLWPLSLIYRALFVLHRLLYRAGVRSSHHVPVPLIVVGNVVAGGAGKTPIVIELVTYFSKLGVAVGVTSRGYGRQDMAYREVQPTSAAPVVGDEPLLIHRRTGCPVFVGPSRVEAAQRLLASHPGTELIISDDGLQHLGMHRDIEILVFDERGIGNGFLLPAGPLREPWPRYADLIVYAGAAAPAAGFQVDRHLAADAVGSDGRTVSLQSLRLQQSASLLTAVAGIARPQVFFDMLRDAGLTLSQTIAMGDHESFSDWHSSRPASGTVLCTEKDAVKLWALDDEVLAVPLECRLPKEFFESLRALLVNRCGQSTLGTKLSSTNGNQTT